MIALEDLARVFVEIADTLVDDFDLVEFLEMLTTRTCDLSHATAAGLLLADSEGRLQFMASSNEAVHWLELTQLQAQDGPCLDCYRHGVPVVDADLTRADDRWPDFAPAAVRAGYRSVHAFPLRHQKQVIGALNVFLVETGRLEDDEVRIVQSLADIATIGMLQERAIRDENLLTEQLQHALISRIFVEQAKGVLAHTHGTDVNTASHLLRGYARGHGYRLVDVAADIVTAPRSHPTLTIRT